MERFDLKLYLMMKIIKLVLNHDLKIFKIINYYYKNQLRKKFVKINYNV